MDVHCAGAIMGTYGLTFAAVGLAYTGMDCAAETFRGIKFGAHPVHRLPNSPCMHAHFSVQPFCHTSTGLPWPNCSS